MRSRIARDVFLRRFRLERSYRPPALLRYPEWNYESLLELAVSHAMASRPNLTFLQVGGFDGQANDPIRPLVLGRGLSGAIVEPQRGAVEALRRAYADHPHVRVIQAAVAGEDAERDFFTAEGGAIQVASFDRSHLLRHGIPPNKIVREKVQCLTVASVLRDAGLERVDLVQIDAEGYDFEIIKALDLATLRPAIIRYEHVHLSNDDADASVALLAGHGYRFLSERRDLIALLP
jgi:FkbM family methyltransferase